ncbi:hypothetical protein N7495_001252 [Penicillium taxi]|uniref:uncharacterized protein n=1 Tax=Penicillium taxi TaxID=168475 RepID=UPI002544ED52|nr:uncharacterized protein N7495_001252 [Penicillium taxi]KAJ5908570.1 hypothetical protein N7495_001252 [Penicillium taxi]
MTLLQFLRQARQVHLQFLKGSLTEPPIYVLGNPSADLDSIISAIVFSYCANNRLPYATPRPHVPLLNLPSVPAGSELYRLRPEFITALWLVTNFPALKPDEQFENSLKSAGKLLSEHIVTISDFAQSLKEPSTPNELSVDSILVDWNALPERTEGQPGRGSLSGLSKLSFQVVGCIDHHIDENFISGCRDLPQGQPVIIQPGPGSCTSLIANEMRKRELWTAITGSSDELVQVTKLALAAILIDTSNLTAKGKVTFEDEEAVNFLHRQVQNADPEWDMEAFYEKVLAAKNNSLDLLTLDEVLDRDFKDWTETTCSSGQRVKLGFCSSVKPIRWLVQKAGGPQQLLDGVRSFAVAEGRKLDVVVVMTSFTSKAGEFVRELLICAPNGDDVVVCGIESFITRAGPELDLVDWSALDGELVDVEDEKIRSSLNGHSDLWRRLWIQKNTTASRKQVAPLLRTAFAQL